MNLGMIRINGRFSIDLPFINVRGTDSMLCRGVDGLGPPDTNVFISSGTYQARQTLDRQIIISIGLNPTYASGQSISDLRTYLYGLLTPGGSDVISVHLLDDVGSLWGVTEGVCKRVEPGIFQKEPVVQVTIDCLQPYLRGPEVALSLSNINTKNPQILNIGNALSPFRAELQFVSGRTGWYMRTNEPADNPRNIKRIEFENLPLAAGDILVIDTRPGLRTARRVRGAQSDTLFAAMSSDSEFLMLHAGHNDFVTQSGAFEWLSFKVYPMYWGI